MLATAPTTMHAARPRIVVCTQGAHSGAHHTEFPQKVKKVLGMRKDLEARRVKQLWGIAKAMDEVAREELHSMRTPSTAQAGAEHGVRHDDIDVDFDAVFARADDDEPQK